MTGSSRVTRLRRQAAKRGEARKQVSKRAVLYSRVSTEEQGREGYGLRAQERALRSFAQSQGYEVVASVTDSGVSGATKPEERPGFSEVVRLAEEGEVSVLLVWKFDRLARHLTNAVVTAQRLLDGYGVVLRSVTEPIDTATGIGKTLFAVLAGMAEQERQSITERTLGGKKEVARKGGYAGGGAPYGYRRDKDGGLEVVAEEAATVRRVFAMHRKRFSPQAIADALNAERVPTKRGGSWHRATVRYILENPKYRGRVEYLFRWGEEGAGLHILTRGKHPAILKK